MAPSHSATTGGEAGRHGMPGRYRGMILPAALIAMGLVLPFFMFAGRTPTDAPGLGPGAWPDMALGLMAAFSAIWLVSEWWRARSGRADANPAHVSDEPYSMTKAVVGIGLIALYGAALGYLGFALTSALFIAIWCVYGSLRNPLVVLPVALVGTGVLLWLFMGLALMPLSRGVGIFDNFSIWLLQTLRIY